MLSPTNGDSVGIAGKANEPPSDLGADAAPNEADAADVALDGAVMRRKILEA